MNILQEIEQGQHDWAFTLGVQAVVWGFPLVQCWKDRLSKLERGDGVVRTIEFEAPEPPIRDHA